MNWEEIEKLITQAKGPLDVMENLAHMQRAYYNELIKDGFVNHEAMALVKSTTESALNAFALSISTMGKGSI